ncbi:MAG: hypothetical protein FE78DRAFT_236422 [Acidomyces sp. 'richmondensis']|nr:MAG: hypothetical protein FE78DRAFT_236422 [Acidomyces sp. 'richmondensis']
MGEASEGEHGSTGAREHGSTGAEDGRGEGAEVEKTAGRRARGDEASPAVLGRSPRAMMHACALPRGDKRRAKKKKAHEIRHVLFDRAQRAFFPFFPGWFRWGVAHVTRPSEYCRS